MTTLWEPTEEISKVENRLNVLYDMETADPTFPMWVTYPKTTKKTRKNEK